MFESLITLLLSTAILSGQIVGAYQFDSLCDKTTCILPPQGSVWILKSASGQVGPCWPVDYAKWNRQKVGDMVYENTGVCKAVAP